MPPASGSQAARLVEAVAREVQAQAGAGARAGAGAPAVRGAADALRRVVLCRAQAAEQHLVRRLLGWGCSCVCAAGHFSPKYPVPVSVQ